MYDNVLSRKRRFEPCRKVLVLILSTVDGGVKLEGTAGVSLSVKNEYQIHSLGDLFYVAG
jgi:hypothetical protein